MTNPSKVRVLAIAPNREGFGFALMRDAETLLNWGTRSAGKGDKNANSLSALKKLILRTRPGTFVLPDVFEKGARRGDRIRRLTEQAALLAEKHGLSVATIGQRSVRRFFFGELDGTKYARALKLSRRFPDELADFLPPERQAWMDEHHLMVGFDAVAFGSAYFGLQNVDRNSQKATECRHL